MKTDVGTREVAEAMCRETDEFHPFGNDGELQRDLDRMSREDLHEALNGIEGAEESAEICVGEITEKMQEYFSNPWNHAPGYRVPEIKFDSLPYGTNILKKILSPHGKQVYRNVIARSKIEAMQREQRKRIEVSNIIKERGVTTQLLHETFRKSTKLQLWLTKQVRKKNRRSISGLSEDVTSRLLKTLRFPRCHRWRAVSMIWRRVTPIIKSMISEQENWA
jgi:hypothetical protein